MKSVSLTNSLLYKSNQLERHLKPNGFLGDFEEPNATNCSHHILAHNKIHNEKWKKPFVEVDKVALTGLLECDFTKIDHGKIICWQNQLINIAIGMKLYTGAVMTFGNSQRSWANSKMKLFVENLNVHPDFRNAVLESDVAQQNGITSEMLNDRLNLYSLRRGREKLEKKIKLKVYSSKSKISVEVRDNIINLLLDHCSSFSPSPMMSIQLFRFMVLYTLYKLEQHLTIKHLVKTKTTVDGVDEIAGCLTAQWCKDFIADSYQNVSTDIKNLMRKAHVDSLKDRDIFPKLKYLESLYPVDSEEKLNCENKNILPGVTIGSYVRHYLIVFEPVASFIMFLIQEVISAFNAYLILADRTRPPVFAAIIGYNDNDVRKNDCFGNVSCFYCFD